MPPRRSMLRENLDSMEVFTRASSAALGPLSSSSASTASISRSTSAGSTPGLTVAVSMKVLPSSLSLTPACTPVARFFS